MWTCVYFSPVATLGSRIQEVGMRVAATLEWLNGSHQLEYARDPTHVELNKMLVLLLNNLVAGRMLNPQLDTQKLYDMMAPPLLTKTTPLGRLRFPPLSNLQAVVLKRRQGVASSMGAGNARTVKQALSGVGLQDCTNLPRTGTQQQVESQSQHIQAKVTRRFWLGNRYESQRWPVKTRGLSITEVKNMTGTVTC